MRKTSLFIILLAISLLTFSQESFIKYYDYGGHEVPNDIIELEDGSFIITGYSEPSATANKNFYYLKTDDSGIVIWENIFDLGDNDYGRFIIPNEENCLALGNSDGYVSFLLDVAGNMIDESINTYDAFNILLEYEYYTDTSLLIMDYEGYFGEVSLQGDSISSFESNIEVSFLDGASFSLSHDKNSIFIVGTKDYQYTNTDMQLVQIDFNGDSIMNQNYDFGEGADFPGQIMKFQNDEYLIGGSARGPNGIFLIRIDEVGAILWDSVYSVLGNDYYQHFSQILVTNDDNILVVEHSSNISNGDEILYLAKIDNNGEILWEEEYEGIIPVKTIQTSDNGYAIIGKTVGSNSDIVFVKVNENGQITSMKNINITDNVQLYPNPTNDIIQIQIDDPKSEMLVEIIGVDGKIMEQKSFFNQSRLSIDISNYNDGIYFVKVTVGNESTVKKVVKE